MINQQVRVVYRKSLYVKQPQGNRRGKSCDINMFYKLRHVISFLGFTFFIFNIKILNKKSFYSIPYL